MGEKSSVGQRLAEPFLPSELKFKPQSVKGNRALAVAYIDGRTIQDRLDDVLDVDGWSDEYELLADGSVMCRLSVRIDTAWITKCDVGSPSTQPDGGDRLKAAFSDALKRAAVKFGVGRYLHRLPAVWCDYDPQRKQFSGTPQLPAWALPATYRLPATGEELHKRLRAKDALLAGEGKIALGAMLSHVAAAGEKAGFGMDIAKWGGPAIQFAVDTVKQFEANPPAPLAKRSQARR